MIICQTAILIFMARSPKAVEMAATLGKRTTALLMGTLCFIISLFFAMEGANHLRESLLGVRAGSQIKAQGVDSRIAGFEDSRRQLPAFEFTTAGAVEMARTAAGAATAAVKAECGNGVGGNCRKRQDEERDANAAVTKAEANHGLTEQAKTLDAQLAAAKLEKEGQGVIPKDVDPAAARTSQIIGVSEDKVTDWFPAILAAFFELLAWVGPWLLIEGKKKPAIPEAKPVPVVEAVEPKPVDVIEAPAEPVLLIEAPKQVVPGNRRNPPAPTTRNPRKPSSAAIPAIADRTAVREWRDSRIVACAGQNVQAKPAFEVYQAWCAEIGRAPVTMRTWGDIMKKELGMACFMDSSKITYYRDIAIVAPKLSLVRG